MKSSRRPRQPAKQVRLIARFNGRVQGVGFRATALLAARDLDVHGFVRNEPGGSVLLDVDGKRTELVELLNRIQNRPAGFIETCDVSWTDSLQRETGFSIA
ncbi:MAG: hypothetical protein CBB71_09635 [Rhodopirellula sp. TMED11]|nr:MAG: hypothetical protein CBB71_09635 [Rhodopirellula sp. TMED11]